MRKNEIQFLDIPIPSTEALERQVLADATDYQESLGDIAPLIHPDFFTTPQRRHIWEVIVERANKGEDTSLVTLYNTIGDVVRTEVAPVAGRSVPSQVLFNAAALRDGAAKRRAYLAATNFLQKTVAAGTTEHEIISGMEELTHEVEGPAPIRGEVKLDQALAQERENIEHIERLVQEGKTTRVTTGFHYVNRVLNNGLKPGQLVILAARPSVGKTAVMLNMAKAAAGAGFPCLVYSLEMPCDELTDRLLFSTGKVRPYQLNNGCVDWKQYKSAENDLKQVPIYINDFSRSLADIITRLTQAVKKGRCKIAFIDYLGLMDEVLNPGNAKVYQAIARVTGTLKTVAKRLQIPIVLLSQLNRDSAREDRAPELYDMRDSGSIEQDADIVLMIESKMAKEGRIILHLRKNRGGQKEWSFPLTPNDTFSAFTEEEPIATEGATLPEEAKPTQAALDLTPKNDDLPF